MADLVSVPDAPGVPDVLRPPGYDAAPLVPLVADALNAFVGFGAPAYGVWQGGVPVVIAEIVNDVGYSKSYTISDFPIEQGAFQTYDKVEQPFEARVRFTSGTNVASREALIASVEAIIGDLQSYDIVTPERVYVNANVVREEWRRENSGLLTIEVSLQEIRLPSANSGLNPGDPATVSNVTPQTPTNSQLTAAGLSPITTPAGSGGIGAA